MGMRLCRPEQNIKPVSIYIGQTLYFPFIICRSQVTVHAPLIHISSTACQISIIKTKMVDNRTFITQLLCRVHKIQPVAGSNTTFISTTVIHLGFWTESLLRRNNNHTVSSTGPINRRSRSILQNTDRLYVFRHNITYTILHNCTGIISRITLRYSRHHRQSVNNPQRFGIPAQIILPTNGNLGTGSRSPGNRRTVQTGYHTFQNTVQRSNTLHLQIFSCNNGSTTGHVLFLHRFHTGNDHFIQAFRILMHHHLHFFGRIFHRETFRLHPDKREKQLRQFLPYRKTYRKTAFSIRSNTNHCPFQ